MPSDSLAAWQIDRMARLQDIDTQTANSLTSTPPNLALADENLRGYTILLSAHFQGFCRDLYTECTQIVVDTMPPSLQPLAQTQFTCGLALDRNNANLETLKKDFERLDLNFSLTSTSASQSHLANLKELNTWRNVVAHQGVVSQSGFPPITSVRAWRTSCDALATLLDAMMYNRLNSLLGKQPWVP